MSFEKIESEGLKSTYKVIVPNADVEAEVDAKLAEFGKTAKLPGFRPGKIPAAVLKSRFRPQALAEAQQAAMNTAVGGLLDAEGVTPAVQPQVTGTPVIEDGKDMEFDLVVEAMPKIELMDFAKLDVERLKVAVSDEQVAEEIEKLKERYGRPEKVARNRKLKEGDFANINFEGSVDGEAHEGMKGEEFDLLLGSNQFIPGFEDQLIGVKGGEEKEVVVTFPEDYNAEELQGKEAVFKVTVNEVRERKPADFDQLLEYTGRADAEDLNEFVREQVGSAHKQKAQFVLKRQLLDKLQEAHKFDLPPSMVDSEFESIWSQIEKDIENDRLDEDDKGKSEDELKAEYRAIAERRVGLGLVLSEVTTSNSLQVTQEELNGALQREIARYPGQEQEVLKFFQQTPAAVQQITAPIMEEKAVDFILERASVSEKEVSVEELDEAASV